MVGRDLQRRVVDHVSFQIRWPTMVKLRLSKAMFDEARSLPE
jgi:hypothetical protein